jgi:hypothetical protein
VERYTDDMSTLTITELIDKLTLIYEKYGDIEVFVAGAEQHQELPIRGAAVIRNSDPQFVLLNRPKTKIIE